MAVPDYQTLMRPLLEYLQHGEVRVRDLIDPIADQFHLSEAERNAKIPSGKQGLLYNRIHWAKTYLNKAGLISSSKRGFASITPRSLKALQTASHIDNEYLAQFKDYQDFRERKNLHKEKTSIPEKAKSEELDPEESLYEAYQSLKETISSDLLSRLIASSPDFFEKAIVTLLVEMGYGGTQEDAIRKIGQTGDNGVDGVIDQDFLGVDQIYVQAKRYKDTNTVGAGDIRDFFGALNYHNAQKGIFITSSRFTKSAKETAEKLGTNIVLIDGAKLVELMLRFNVGCSEKEALSIKEVDDDFFDELL